MHGLPAVSHCVIGIDPDPAEVQPTQRRLHSIDNASIEHTDFQDFTAPGQSFDVIRSWPAAFLQPSPAETSTFAFDCRLLGGV